MHDILQEMDRIRREISGMDERISQLTARQNTLKEDLANIERFFSAEKSGEAAKDMPAEREVLISRASGAGSAPQILKQPLQQAKKLQQPKKPAKEFDERMLGKYLVGVLACVLVLLAVGVLAASVWNEIPDVAKFGLILLAGVAMQSAGIFFLAKSGVGNGFWMSMAGLGSSVAFLDLVAGCVGWNLYPDWIAGIFGILWFAIQFFFAAKFSSVVFYSVTYIGGVITVWLAAPFEAYAARDVMPMAFIICIMLAIGTAGNKIRPKRYLLYMNAAFAALCAFRIHMAGYALAFPVVFSILLAFLALWQACGIFDEKQHAWNACMAFLGSLQLAVYCSDFEQFLSDGANGPSVFVGILYPSALASAGQGQFPAADAVSAAVCIALLLLAVCFSGGRRYAVLLGSSPVLILAAGELSDIFIGNEAAVLCAAACLLALQGKIRKNMETGRIALWLWIAAAGSAAWDMPGSIYVDGMISPGAFSLLVPPLFLAAAGFAVFRAIQLCDEGFWPDVELLLSMCVMGLGAALLCNLFAGNLFGMAVFAICLLYHRWKFLREQKFLSAVLILWTVLSALVCACVHFEMVFFPSNLDKAAGSMILILFSCSSVCAAVWSGSLIRTVFSVLFANWTLFFVGNAAAGIEGLAISVLGLVLSAGFIALGFRRRSKGMRLFGLGFMILYVLKISLFDVAASGSIFGTAGGLLLGGAVCFGVSFAYNRIDRAWAENDAGK